MPNLLVCIKNDQLVSTSMSKSFEELLVFPAAVKRCLANDISGQYYPSLRQVVVLYKTIFPNCLIKALWVLYAALLKPNTSSAP